MKLLISISILFFLASCNPCKFVAKHPQCFPVDSFIIEKTVIQRDSFTYTEPDTLSMQLLFECDSNNNVLIRELNNASTKGFDIKYIFKDNRLNLTAYVDSIAILNKLIETTTNKEVIKMNPVNDVLKSNNEKLEKQTKFRGKVILIESILLFIIAIMVFIKIN